MPPRPPEFRNYRVATYCAYALVAGVLFFQLIHGVAGDLYGRGAPEGAALSPAACVDELDGLYAQLAARAVEPGPRGVNQGELAREWDVWSSRWESQLDALAQRCRLSTSSDPAMSDLADAQEALEDLRRDLGRSGDEISSEAGRAQAALGAARGKVFKKP